MQVDGVFGREAVRAASPLALLQATVAGTMAEAPMGRTVGFRLVGVEPGSATFEAMPTADHLNPMGTVHGGWTTSVLDSAMGCAVLSTLAAGELCTTLELKVNFTRAVRADAGPLTAVGNVIVRGRRIVTAEARMLDPARRILAHATSTLMIVPVDGFA